MTDRYMSDHKDRMENDKEVEEWKETLDVVIERYENCEDDTATFLRKLKNISKSLHHQLQKAREEERERFKEAFEEELRSNRANLPYYRYIARWKEELFDQSELDQDSSNTN